MSIYGYARVSTDKQADEGESLTVQERQLRGWCLMHGEEMAEVFIDRGVSGSMPLDHRPAGGDLLKVLKGGDTVVAAKLDRLFRSSLDALQTIDVLRKRKVKVWLLDLGEVTGNGVAKVFMTIAAAFAELEREQIVERVTGVKRDQRDRGRYLGGRPPFGFKVAGDGSLALVELEQAIIAEILGLRDDGQSFRAVQAVIERRYARRISLAALKRIVDQRPA